MHLRTGVLLSLVSLVLVLGCEPMENGTSYWDLDPSKALDPSGGQPLTNMDTEEVHAAVFGAWIQIADGRDLGMKTFTDQLRTELTARNWDPKLADKINLEILEDDLPSDLSSNGTTTKSGNVATRTLALTPDYAKYFKCPIKATDKSQANTCAQMVAGVAAKVQAALTQSKAKAEAEIKKLHKSLSSEAQQFVSAWAQAAIDHGSKVAAVYAEHHLRATARCDTSKNAMQISYMLGVQQGHKIVLEMRAWARSQVAACVVNVDEIVKKVEHQSLAKIQAWMKAHAVCKDEDISSLDQTYQKAEIKRKDGIKVGISQQVKVLRSELFNYRSSVPCGDTRCIPPNTTKGGECHMDTRRIKSNGGYKGWWIEGKDYKVCCRKQRRSGRLRCLGHRKSDNKTIFCAETANGSCISCQTKYIYIGSPVAIDLDGDGLTVTRAQVRFDLLADGNPQRVSWIGPRDALLVLDLDHDGVIASGSELFGNSTDCGGHRCYDGADAMAQYDDNGDGLLDARDAIFPRLMLWLDLDQDGVSDPGELTRLAASKVQALSVQPAYRVEHRQDASVTARFQVLTSDGFRDAHDVWFHMDLAPANLASMMPAM